MVNEVLSSRSRASNELHCDDPAKHPTASTRDLGVAWVLLCIAIAVHVTDEALTGFLSVYNPTVPALRAKLGFWPMPTFQFRDWLTGLILGVIILLVLSPPVFGGSRRIRPFFYFLAIVMILNGLGHTAGTIFGQTVSSILFRGQCRASTLLPCS